jgi:uncharacterized protein (DUF302 family)
MEIMAKDFKRHIGKSILMPHPSNPLIMPCKVLIVGTDKKKTILKREDNGLAMAANYSKDKTKYKILE